MSKINIQSEIMILMISLNPSVRSVAGLGIIQDKTKKKPVCYSTSELHWQCSC